MDLSSTVIISDHASLPRKLSLIVIAPEGVRTLSLPDGGEVTIGRAPESDIVIDDPSISRVHARLFLGERLAIEDLSSANGTTVLDRRILPGEHVEISAGQALSVGGSILIIQNAALAKNTARVRTHSQLEARLEDECARSTGSARAPFCFVRLHIGGTIERPAIEELLLKTMRSGDVVASYAPREYELLLVDTARGAGEHFTAELAASLIALGGEVDAGLASHPDDGVSGEALIQEANVALREAAAAPARTKRIAQRNDSDPVVLDAAMRELHRVIGRVAQGSISVLLIGETGAGKEVLAEELHRRSPRHQGPFVRLNCAAISETLVESELFGYEKGAFTGADRTKRGLLEAAHDGTLLLDELGELPLGTQAKLLRAIESREVLRVGGIKPRAIDVRFLAATNRDLTAEIARGTFRSDLYYRLNGITISVPPLRERKSEIVPLAKKFVVELSRAMGLAPLDLTAPAIRCLERYHWPGNIRELRNMIERAVLLAEGDQIEPVHLAVDKLASAWSDERDETGELDPPAIAEKNRIVGLLEACLWNQTRAAEMLGVSRQTLSKWMTRYRIPRPRKRPA